MLQAPTVSISVASSCQYTCIASQRYPPTHNRFRSGWDIHDTVYPRELLISNRANGYRDLIASIDLATYRRIPWENNVPFFLVSFLDPDTKEPICVDPRGALRQVVTKAQSKGWKPVAGCEYEVCCTHIAQTQNAYAGVLVLPIQRYLRPFVRRLRSLNII